jgi:RadC-like JAB domain
MPSCRTWLSSDLELNGEPDEAKVSRPVRREGWRKPHRAIYVWRLCLYSTRYNSQPGDIAVTRAIVQAGKLLDVGVLDHLVIGNGRHVSLKERGLGFSS